MFQQDSSVLNSPCYIIFIFIIYLFILFTSYIYFKLLLFIKTYLNP